MSDGTPGEGGEGGGGTPPPSPPAFTPYTAEQIKGFFGAEDAHQGLLDGFTKMANDHQLSKAAIESFGEYEKAYVTAAEEASEQAWNTLQDEWKAELEADPELKGGEGLEKNLSNIATVIKDFGGEPDEAGVNEFQKMLNTTGAGNHPAMARFLMRLLPSIPAEGRPTGGRPGPGGGETSLADRFFS